MGASASVHAVYQESGKWFKEYFDTDMYRRDFDSMDKDGDGGIGYSELLEWLQLKVQTEGGSWKIFLANRDVIQYAHVQSSQVYRKHDTVLKLKVIGIDDFRTFLIHFFAISVLWIHFKNADEFTFGTTEFNNLKLNFEEFCVAVKTLTATHEQEECSQDQLQKDFTDLDLDKSGWLGFAEVCAHCCKYIDPEFDPTSASEHRKHKSAVASQIEALDADRTLPQLNGNAQTTQAYANAVTTNSELSPLVMSELDEKSNAKTHSQFLPLQARNQVAVDALEAEMEKEKASVQFQQIKTINAGEIDDLMKSLA